MQAPLDIHIIGFAGYDDSATFTTGLKRHIRRLRKGQSPVAVRLSLVRTAAEAAQALCLDTRLAIVSGHAVCSTNDAWIGDGSAGSLHWLCFSDFQDRTSSKIAARAGIVWDVCNAGRPIFRQAILPHLAHPIAHVGVIGTVYHPDSVAIVPTILRHLYSPANPIVTPDTVAEAAERAMSRTGRRLVCRVLE